MKHTHLPIVPSVLAALGLVATMVPASAQSKIVSPRASTNVYGGANNSIPWGPYISLEQFYHQVDEGLLGQVLVLKGMAFRHYYAMTEPALSYTATVKLGDAATTAATISTTFASNVAGPQTTVLNGTINFPNRPPKGTAPEDFDSPVPFTTPHVYIGTKPLLLEVFITTASTLSPTTYMERGPGATHISGPRGQGCRVTGNSQPMSATGSCTTTAYSDTLANGPSSTPVVLVLGDTADLVAGLPLPIHLALIGSTGCYLHTSILATIGMTTTPSGTASLSVPYAMSPAISAVRFRSQWATIDAGAVKSSNGLDHSVPYGAGGVPWPQARAYAYSFGSTPPAIANGFSSNLGLVTEWWN